MKNPTPTLFWVLGSLLLPLSASAYFSDVPSSHPNEGAIEFVQSEGIVQGYSDETFRPDVSINRAEFTKIIIEASVKKEEIENCLVSNPDLFSDTPKDQWYAKYVCVAKEQGIIGGYPEGTFKPEQSISFVEAAKILAESIDMFLGIFADFNESNPDPIWYREYVARIADYKAIPTNITRPEQTMTRGDIAEMLYRLLHSNAIRLSYRENEMKNRFGHLDIITPQTYQRYKDVVPVREHLNRVPQSTFVMIMGSFADKESAQTKAMKTGGWVLEVVGGQVEGRGVSILHQKGKGDIEL